MPHDTVSSSRDRTGSPRERRPRAVARRRRRLLRSLVAPVLAASVVTLVARSETATVVSAGESVDLIAAKAREVVASGAGDHDGIGQDDGYIDEGGSVSPFASDLPAIARLDPALRTAVQDAARAAEADGIELVVTSGWRSARYQGLLLDRAIRTYGSREEAARLVLPPEESEHVHGDAVDVGATDAAYWVAQHGSRFGLCQTYANEIWHFELATAPGDECPAPFADPTQR